MVPHALLTLLLTAHAVTHAVAFFLATLKRVVLRAHARAWDEARAEAARPGFAERVAADERDWGRASRMRGLVATFAGPAPGYGWRGFVKVTTHTIPYVWAIAKVVVWHVPRALWHAAITKGGWQPPPNLAWRLVTETPLIIVAEHDVVRGLLIVETPPVDAMPATWTNWRSVAGLRVVLSTTTHAIVEATQQGSSIVVPRGMTTEHAVAAMLHAALVVWIHPKSHALAERSARDIVASNATELEPSSRYVASLHEGLLFNALSPAGSGWNPFHMLSNIDALLTSAMAPLAHRLQDSKRDVSRYYAFVAQAVPIVRSCLAKHNIKADAHALAHNMVVHAVDHYCFYKVMRGVSCMSLDVTGSWRSFWASLVFTHVWIPFMHNPYEEPELLREHVLRGPGWSWWGGRNAKGAEQVHPFYADLFAELNKVDEEFAGVVTLSTSW